VEKAVCTKYSGRIDGGYKLNVNGSNSAYKLSGSGFYGQVAITYNVSF
jgi:hypothetical protein